MNVVVFFAAFLLPRPRRQPPATRLRMEGMLLSFFLIPLVVLMLLGRKGDWSFPAEALHRALFDVPAPRLWVALAAGLATVWAAWRAGSPFLRHLGQRRWRSRRALPAQERRRWHASSQEGTLACAHEVGPSGQRASADGGGTRDQRVPLDAHNEAAKCSSKDKRLRAAVANDVADVSDLQRLYDAASDIRAAAQEGHAQHGAAARTAAAAVPESPQACLPCRKLELVPLLRQVSSKVALYGACAPCVGRTAHKDWGAGVQSATRRRFASGIRQSVLRIRIIGADPDHLPGNWRELVFAHFNDAGASPRACALACPSASYLATGVAVRRGSIYMTVSLVQLPNQGDGGEGASGARQVGGADRDEAALAEAAAAAEAQPEAGPPDLAAQPDVRQCGGIPQGEGQQQQQQQQQGRQQPQLGFQGEELGRGPDAAGRNPPPLAAAATDGDGSAPRLERTAISRQPHQPQSPLSPPHQQHPPPDVRHGAPGVGQMQFPRSEGDAVRGRLKCTDFPPATVCSSDGAPQGGVQLSNDARVLASSSGHLLLGSANSNVTLPHAGAGSAVAAVGPVLAAATAGPGAVVAHGGTNAAADTTLLSASLTSGGLLPGRRRIAHVWRTERLNAFHSTSPASTPGNSSNPLHILCPAASSSFLGSGPQAAASGASTAAPGPSGGSRSMRYTPMLSPAQHASICAGSSPCAPTGSSLELPYLPYQHPPHRMPSGLAASAALRAAGGGSGGTAAVQISQHLLDALQLRNRDRDPTAARQAAATPALLSAVGQLDGGLPHHLRHVLAMESWDVDDGASSSWEVDGVYERPLPPPPPPFNAASQQAGSPSLGPPPALMGGLPGRRRAEEMTMAAGGGMFLLPDGAATVLPPPLAAGASLSPLQQHLVAQAYTAATTAGQLPLRGAADLRPRAPGPTAVGMTTYGGGGAGAGGPLLQHGPGAGLPGQGFGGSAGPTWQAAAAATSGVWPSHTAGLAVLADPSTLPVRDVAVKPVLICKAPLVCAAAAGGLAASIPQPATGPSAAAAAASGGPAPSLAAPAAAAVDTGPDVRSGPDSGGGAAAFDAAAAVDSPPSELHLSLMCAPTTVSELSVMLRYCGPASVFGEQTYLPVQLQLDSTSPAVTAAIRLQAAAADRDRRGGGDTQAARDVAEAAATEALPAHATVRTALAGLACPGVLYVELWHGPQLCACLPVLLLPKSAASWAHEVCSLWQQQAEEGEAAAAAAAAAGAGGMLVAQGRAGASAVPAAAHQVVEDLGGWLTYAAHKRYVAELAATAGAAAAASISHSISVSLASGGIGGRPTTGLPFTRSVSLSAAADTPPQVQGETYGAWLWDAVGVDGLVSSSATSPAAAGAAPASAPLSFAGANAGNTGAATAPRAAADAAALPGPHLSAFTPYGGGGGAAYDNVVASGSGNAYCNRELFHDMMLQEGYNWLADCVEAGCCGLANALMESLLAAGCSAAEVLRTCRSADGLPLMHAATLSSNPAMMELVWRWGQATGVDVGWAPSGVAVAVPAAAEAAQAHARTYDRSSSLCPELEEAAEEAAAVGPPSPSSAASRNAAAAAAAGGGISERDAAREPRIERTLLARAACGLYDNHGSARGAAVAVAAAVGRAMAWAPEPPSLGAALAAMHAALRLCDAATVVRLYGTTLATALRSPRSAAAAWGLTAATSATKCAAKATAAARVALRPRQWARRPDGRGAGQLIGLLWLRLGGRAGGTSLARAGSAAVRLGDRAIGGLHSALLRVSVVGGEGGAEEQRFLRHFQLRHGWVFSAWCWSMIPLYVLILWRYLLEGQWAKLVLTPLWMWMYVVCAAADVVGATAAYRPRTEALAAAMHLSHTLSKALACAGLPAYPIPPGRLYWMDVLACATLSALCEPVRICIALPLRFLNFAVSTVLYRLTGTAPSLMEAALLSASCHCFGLLMQHAVESHYRRDFAAANRGARQRSGSGGVLASAKARDAAGAAQPTAGRNANKTNNARKGSRNSSSSGGSGGAHSAADAGGPSGSPPSSSSSSRGARQAALPTTPLTPGGIATERRPAPQPAGQGACGGGGGDGGDSRQHHRHSGSDGGDGGDRQGAASGSRGAPLAPEASDQPAGAVFAAAAAAAVAVSGAGCVSHHGSLVVQGVSVRALGSLGGGRGRDGRVGAGEDAEVLVLEAGWDSHEVVEEREANESDAYEALEAAAAARAGTAAAMAAGGDGGWAAAWPPYGSALSVRTSPRGRPEPAPVPEACIPALPLPLLQYQQPQAQLDQLLMLQMADVKQQQALVETEEAESPEVKAQVQAALDVDEEGAGRGEGEGEEREEQGHPAQLIAVQDPSCHGSEGRATCMQSRRLNPPPGRRRQDDADTPPGQLELWTGTAADCPRVTPSTLAASTGTASTEAASCSSAVVAASSRSSSWRGETGSSRRGEAGGPGSSTRSSGGGRNGGSGARHLAARLTGWLAHTLKRRALRAAAQGGRKAHHE